MLTHHAGRHGADVWVTYGRCLQGMLLIKRDGLDAGVPVLSAGVAEDGVSRRAGGRPRRHGRSGRGLTVLDETLAQSDKAEERWILAELLRLKGELVPLQHLPNAAAIAADHFQKSLEWARRQCALAWELRSATSLARLWHRQRKTSQTRTLIPIDRPPHGQPITAALKEGKVTSQEASLRRGRKASTSRRRPPER